MHQVPFEDYHYATRPESKKTPKQKFLEEMDRVIPWDTFASLIAPFYPKGERGRPPISLETKLRIYFLQQWYGLSDPSMEHELQDHVAFRVFARVRVNQVPDETTICKFRHLLEEHGLAEKIFEACTAHLEARGKVVKDVTIVDSTIIAAPTSTKNADGQRDPEMKSTRKGKNWHFGMKAPMGTDPNGVVHSASFTAAHVHDATEMDRCLHGEEQEVYGDKAYASRARQEKAKRKG